jgi:hypothetical protein
MTYKDLMLRLHVLAKNVGRTLEPLEIDFYSECFFQLTDDQICSLGDYFAQCYKHRNLPSISEIEDFIYGKKPSPEQHFETTSEDSVQVAISDIFAAMSRHGIYKELEAKHALSPLAWQIVKSMGGWWTLCSIENKDLAVIRAQMRKVGRTLLRTMEPQKIMLQESTDPVVLTLDTPASVH